MHKPILNLSSAMRCACLKKDKDYSLVRLEKRLHLKWKIKQRSLALFGTELQYRW